MSEISKPHSSREESLQGAWRLAQERAVRVIELEGQVRSLQEQLETAQNELRERGAQLAEMTASRDWNREDLSSARRLLEDISQLPGNLAARQIADAWLDS